MAFTPAQQIEYRKKLKAKGVCVLCRKAKAMENKVLCETCSDGNDRRRKFYQSDPTICSTCGRKLDEYSILSSVKSCAMCLDANWRDNSIRLQMRS
jgi:hypothetical protein